MSLAISPNVGKSIDIYLIGEIPHQLVKAVFSGQGLPIALQEGRVTPAISPNVGKSTVNFVGCRRRLTGWVRGW